MNVIQTILDYNKSKESGGKTDITKSDIISALGYTPISELEKGANSGIAELDDNGKVLTSELPSYVDDVEEFNNLAELQKHTGEASKIYITLDDNKCYRWGGTAYVEISSSITLGETSGTAFRGDLGKEAYDKSHTHSNKEVIDSITSEDITNWNNKSDFDGKYTSLTDTPTIPTVTNDLTNELKANYDLAYTQTHTHSNKELLDKLSLNKDNKLLYNGDKVDSDVDLTAIIDDSTITDKTTWSSNKINTTIPKTWVGTKADYEQIKDTLENGTIVYITDDETVILYDKAEMEKIAAQVAEDRTAAETAAQTAQAVADSLPDDYTTAVGKIAENTAEISAVKLTDKELTRRVNALYDMGNGITHQFETDTDTAYAKTVPTGAKLMSVKSVGGHSEVIDGEIVSAGTESVVEQGKNLWNWEGYTASDLVDLKAGYWGVRLSVKPNSAYCVSVIRDTALCGTYGKLIGADKRDIEFFGHKTISSINAYTGHPITFQTADENYVYVAINSFNGFDTWKSDFLKYFPNFQIEKSSTATAYAPYHSNVYQIPEAVRNLPGYGWSAGTARNYVDYENKRYVQCVGKYTFTGNENWVASGDNQYYAVLKTPATKVFNMNTKSNCLMATIPTETVNSVYGGTKTGLGINFLNNVSYAYISADDYNNRVSKINGQDMYYELANPIVTDISTMLADDFLRNIEVEAGGSITFQNSNGDDYRIPVPNEEEYIVKLSEVGGTT